MGYLNNASLSRTRLRNDAIGEDFIATPTFTEATSAAFKITRATELMTSGAIAHNRYLAPQKAQLEQMKAEGTISPEAWSAHVKTNRRGKETDWSGLATMANEEYGGEFDFSQETINAKIAAEVAAQEAILSKGSGWDAAVGGFVGTGVAMGTDPFTLASFAVGAPVRLAATTLGTVAKMAFREGALNVGVEAVIQTNIYDFKQRIGMQYNLSDAAANLGAAFLFGGAIGGGRGAYRAYTGDVRISDAIQTNDAIISELSGKPSLDSVERANLNYLEQVQAFFKEPGGKPPDPKTLIGRFSSGTTTKLPGDMSVREGYDKFAQRSMGIYVSNGKIARALRKVFRALDDEPAGTPPSSEMVDDVTTAIRTYGAQERSAERGTAMLKEEYLNEVRAELIADTSQRLPRGERKTLQTELEDLRTRFNRVTDEEIPQGARRGVPARKARQQGQKKGRQAGQEERTILRDRITAIEQRLSQSAKGEVAEADLTRLDQGLVPGQYQRGLDAILGERPLQLETQAMVSDMDFVQEYMRNLARDPANAQMTAEEAYRSVSRAMGKFEDEVPMGHDPSSVAAMDDAARVADTPEPQGTPDVASYPITNPDAPAYRATENGLAPEGRTMREFADAQAEDVQRASDSYDQVLGCVTGG